MSIDHYKWNPDRKVLEVDFEAARAAREAPAPAAANDNAEASVTFGPNVPARPVMEPAGFTPPPVDAFEEAPSPNKRFGVAPAGYERSKAQILAENQLYRQKEASMGQLLAAICIAHGDGEKGFELWFDVSDLESLSPEITRLEINDGRVRLSVALGR